MASAKTKVIGEAISRIDGILKVTGAADYATDWPIRNIAHAFLVKSTIAAGTISEIDTTAAEKSPGIIAVLTHKNAPKLTGSGNLRGGSILQDPKVEFFGQHIAVVVAETYEQARYAAGLVKTTYQRSEPKVNFERDITAAVVPGNRADALRGDFEAGFQSAEKKIDVTYNTPIEHHQPMAPHATIALWEGNNLTLYNESQIVGAVQGALAGTFGLKPEDVRVVTPHVGGGFGSKGGAWSNVVIAAMAARLVNRPVKLALTRQNMVNSVGLRQRNRQR